MSIPRRPRGDTFDSNNSSPSQPRASHASYPNAGATFAPPTYASFSPATLASPITTNPVSAAKRLSTILVHQKSPLLLATPPQVTRALTYSHPFLLPLNKLAGLLTWTTGDPWESFLLVAVFWAAVLYGDVAIRLAGPVVLVLLLIGGMYGRRFSPMSSSGWREDGGAGSGPPIMSKTTRRDNSGTGGKDTGGEDAAGTSAAADEESKQGHSRVTSEATNTKHQKTLDEIVETLKDFTARCNILLEPLLELTDFLSTQRTATSATTRPALSRLLVRLLLCTPFWVALTLPPLRIVTTRRVVLCLGTIGLTWHARVVKAGRTILWRSASVRRLAVLLTGLDFTIPRKSRVSVATEQSAAQEALERTRQTLGTIKFAARAVSRCESELTKAVRRARGATDAGVRFTFIIYENQRRWVGLGWTNSLFAYERAAWTDEHNNAVPPKDQFELPEVEEDSAMRWRWAVGSRWRVDGVPDEAVVEGERGKWDYDGEAGKNGWVYYDNKWQNGRRGQDGWGRWSRRRKWYRDAELVDVSSNEDSELVDDTSTEMEHTCAEGAPMPVCGSTERAHSQPPRPTGPSLAPPFATTQTQAMSVPNLSSNNKSEALAGTHPEETEANEKVDDVALMLSSPSRSARFSIPSLRRRVADGKENYHVNVTSNLSSRGGRKSRRTSDMCSEDGAASLERALGLDRRDRGNDGWGVGDEVLMGLN